MCHPYWIGGMKEDEDDEDDDPTYQESGEKSGEEGVDDVSSESDDSEGMDWGYESDMSLSETDSADDEAEFEQLEVTPYLPASAAYKIVRDAIERDATAESCEQTRFSGLCCSHVARDEDSERDSEDDFNGEPGEEAGTDYARFFPPPSERFSQSHPRGVHFMMWSGNHIQSVSRREISRLAGRGSVEGLAEPIFDETRSAILKCMHEILGKTEIYFFNRSPTIREVKLTDVIRGIKANEQLEDAMHALPTGGVIRGSLRLPSEE